MSARPTAQPPFCPLRLVGMGRREQAWRESWEKDEEVVVHKEKPQCCRALRDWIVFPGFICQNSGE